MTTPNKIDLIVKFLNNQSSVSELEELEIWIKDPNNEKVFKSYVKTNYAIDYTMREFDSNKVKTKLLEEISKERKVIKLKKAHQTIYYAAAAIVVGVLATAYYFKDNIFSHPVENTTPVIVNNQIVPGSDKATLTLENGEVVTLEKGTTYQTASATSNGKEIVYSNINSTSKELVFNYLTVPRGGQFYIELSDGTRVWLNSETQLKFPVSFVEGEIREVELVYGEAYFEVSPSSEHKGSKFKVFNQSQEIEVLGTEFNLKAYKDESSIYTTLVEGKVSISIPSGNQLLKPSEQSTLNLLDNTMSVAIVNVYNEISWKEGVFSFRKKSLGEITKVLSRWYDVDINFLNPEIEVKGFNGVIGKEQRLEDILEAIKNYGVINDYEINNKIVVLK